MTINPRIDVDVIEDVDQSNLRPPRNKNKTKCPTDVEGLIGQARITTPQTTPQGL
jgi:hypothetical protein